MAALVLGLGHPEVYILILPAMGIVSEILPTFSRRPLVWLPDDGLFWGGDRFPRLHRLEPPHVHHRYGHCRDLRLLHYDHADLDPNRGEDL